MVNSSDVVGEAVGEPDQGDDAFDDFVQIPHPRPVSSSTLVPEYKSLGASRDEIRILKLHRSDGNDLEPITCSLQHVEFRHDPHYEALSYTWGTRKELQPTIIVDGRHVTIRENLWTALHALRLPYIDRKLWVDSICINQADIKERNIQVRLMPFIYARAECVAVWLGPDISGSASILSRLSNFYNTTILSKDRPAKAQLAILCESDYWQRLWIVQEVQMAARINVYCGSYWTSWPLFIQAVEECTALERSVPLRLERHRERQSETLQQLSILLDYYQHALCEDPRDKIFGLAGLATDIDDKTFVDYSKSVDDVWRDTVIFQHELQLRAKYGDLEDKYTKLPFSRILPFSQFLRGLLKLPCRRPEVHLVSEGNVSLPLNWSRGIIRLEAYIIGQIEHIGPSFTDILGSFDATRKWDSDLIRLGKTHGYDITRTRRANSKFIRCLLEMANSDLSKFEPLILGISWKAGAGSVLGDRITEKADSSTESAFSDTNINGQSKINANENKAASDADRPNISSFEAYRTLYAHRILYSQSDDDAQSSGEPRVFAIRPGLSGLAPHNAMVGDIICRVRESEITLVLRQTGDRLLVVGRALVRGYSLGHSEDKDVDGVVSSEFLANFPSGVLMDVDTLGFLTSP